MRYAVACSSSQARVQDFLSGKLQVCKVLIGGSNFFEVVHLQFYMETYKNWMWFSRGWRSGPSAFIWIRTCFFFKAFFTYLRIFHPVLNHLTRLFKVRTWPITWYLETWVRQSYKYDVFSETHFLVITENLRYFDETDVRTSQKTTYAQFKIYHTNFIDEIGSRVRCGAWLDPFLGPISSIKFVWYILNCAYVVFWEVRSSVSSKHLKLFVRTKICVSLKTSYF